MAHVGFTKLRNHLKEHFNQVIATGEPLFCTRQGGKGTVVVLSEQQYLSWQAALLKSAQTDAPARQTEAAD